MGELGLDKVRQLKELHNIDVDYFYPLGRGEYSTVFSGVIQGLPDNPPHKQYWPGTFHPKFNGQTVAVKVPRRNSPEQNEQHLSGLNDPLLPTFLGIVPQTQNGGSPNAFVLTRAIGTNLGQFLDHGLLPGDVSYLSRETCGYTGKMILYQLLHACDILHRMALTHGDIELTNVLFQRTFGIASLIDYGNSRQLHLPLSGSSRDTFQTHDHASFQLHSALDIMRSIRVG